MKKQQMDGFWLAVAMFCWTLVICFIVMYITDRDSIINWWLWWLGILGGIPVGIWSLRKI